VAGSVHVLMPADRHPPPTPESWRGKTGEGFTWNIGGGKRKDEGGGEYASPSTSGCLDRWRIDSFRSMIRQDRVPLSQVLGGHLPYYLEIGFRTLRGMGVASEMRFIIHQVEISLGWDQRLGSSEIKLS
jgi:hypothetical protein